MNRRTLLALAVTTGGGVLIGKGQRFASLAEGIEPTDAVNKQQLDMVFDTVTHTTRNIPHENFNFINDFGPIFDCPAPGLARHNIDVAAAWQNKFKLLTGSSGSNFLQATPILLTDIFVDWENGSDDESGGFRGGIANPYKTVKKAIQSTSHTIWMLPGDSKEIVVSDASETVGGNGRPFRLRALIPGTVRFISNSDKCEDLDWTESGNAWTATPSDSRLVESITWMPSPGVYVPVPFNGGMDSGFYWYQDVGTRLISMRAFGKNLADHDIAAQFLIAYRTVDYHTLAGHRFLMQDIDFVGSAPFISRFDATQAIRGEAYLKNVNFILTPSANAYHSIGGLTAAQNVQVYGSSADGFNYYEGDDPTATACTFLEIDCTARYTGWMHSWGGVPSNRNNQGSSGHAGSWGIRVNGDYGEGSYGQGIADTGADAYYWMIGTKVRDPYFDIYGGTSNRYYSLWMEGQSWLDTVQAGGFGSLNGLYMQGGTHRVYACDFRGFAANIAGTGYELIDFIPFGS